MTSLYKDKYILGTSPIIPIWVHIHSIADINELCDIQPASKGTTLDEVYGIKRELLKCMHVHINIGNKKYENYLSVGAEVYKKYREYFKKKSLIISKQIENFLREEPKNIKSEV